jgi:hypothetical protein
MLWNATCLCISHTDCTRSLGKRENVAFLCAQPRNNRPLRKKKKKPLVRASPDVTAYRNPVTLQLTNTIRSYDVNFHPVPYGVTVSCELWIMGFPVCYGGQQHHVCTEGERCEGWWLVSLHVQNCSGRNCIIPLMRRPNTDRAPNMPITLPHKQLLIIYVIMSPVLAVTIRCSVCGIVTDVYPPLQRRQCCLRKSI